MTLLLRRQPRSNTTIIRASICMCWCTAMLFHLVRKVFDSSDEAVNGIRSGKSHTSSGGGQCLSSNVGFPLMNFTVILEEFLTTNFKYFYYKKVMLSTSLSCLSPYDLCTYGARTIHPNIDLLKNSSKQRSGAEQHSNVSASQRMCNKPTTRCSSVFDCATSQAALSFKFDFSQSL